MSLRAVSLQNDAHGPRRKHPAARATRTERQTSMEFDHDFSPIGAQTPPSAREDIMSAVRERRDMGLCVQFINANGRRDERCFQAPAPRDGFCARMRETGLPFVISPERQPAPRPEIQDAAGDLFGAPIPQGQRRRA